MDKKDFADAILKDLTNRLKGKKEGSKRIVSVTLESFLNQDKDKKTETVSEQKLKDHDGKRIVLTENDILNMNVEKLLLPHDAILTPLAKDAARKKGIIIIKEN
ncbi:MAG: hypothetical protein N2486_02925 [Caloramator sp.]|nr:hypothetical protein [Caloramator sp.]